MTAKRPSRRYKRREHQTREAPTGGASVASGHHARFEVAAWLIPGVIVLAIFAAYWTSFAGTFVFDDHVHIHASDRIRALWPPWPLLSGRRPVVDFTLALNYRFGKLEPWGYHLWNVLVHCGAALTLWGLVRRTLLLGGASEESGRSARWIAAAVALIWAVHPLQTQAVTYIIQRGESMMGLFYLLTVYAMVRGATSPRRAPWYALAVLACLLSMGCKAVAITLPVVLILYDRCFLSTTWRETIRQRWALYAAIVLAVVVMAVVTGVAGGVLSWTPRPSTSAGFAFKGIAPGEYLATMPGVIVYYLWLALWPHPLCFDYGWPAAGDLREILAPVVMFLALLAGLGYVFQRDRRLGFIGAAFLLILLPTSSIIPFRDPLVEHRMYLPLAAVVMLIVLAGNRLIARMRNVLPPRLARRHLVSAVLTMSVAIALGWTTSRRNQVYKNDESLWRDVVAKRPESARGHFNLGSALAHSSFAEAMASYRRTVEIDPGYADAHYNLGLGLSGQGRTNEAVAAYRTAIECNPRHAQAHYNLGNILQRRGRAEEAVTEYRAAIKASRGHVRARVNLGTTLEQLGKTAEAVQYYEQAVKLAPDSFDARITLAQARLSSDRLDDAIHELQEILRTPHSDPTGRMRREIAAFALQLGQELEIQKRFADAVNVFGIVITVDSAKPRNLFNLAMVLRSAGQKEEAKQALRAALKQEPDFAPAREALDAMTTSKEP